MKFVYAWIFVALVFAVQLFYIVSLKKEVNELKRAVGKPPAQTIPVSDKPSKTRTEQKKSRPKKQR